MAVEKEPITEGPISTVIFPNHRIVQIPANDVEKVAEVAKAAIAEHAAVREMGMLERERTLTKDAVADSSVICDAHLNEKLIKDAQHG